MIDRSRGFATTKIVEDCAIAYLGHHGEPLTARARLYRTAMEYVLVATSMGANLTATIDKFASIIVRRWEIDPAHLRVVEHFDYRNNTARAASEPAETFAFVGFDWDRGRATNPTWRATVRDDVEGILCGQRLW